MSNLFDRVGCGGIEECVWVILDCVKAGDGGAALGSERRH